MHGGSAEKLQAVSFMLSDDKQKVIVEKDIPLPESNDYKANWDRLVAALPESSCRFLVVDVRAKDPSGPVQSKLLLLSWCPEDCAIKEKMLYASTKDSLKKILEGIKGDFQAADRSDLTYSEAMVKAGFKF